MRVALVVTALMWFGCKDKPTPVPAPSAHPEAGLRADTDAAAHAEAPVDAAAAAAPTDAPDDAAAAAPTDAWDDVMDKVMASPKCCCSLPATTPNYETQPRLLCEQDLHGTCVIARKCRKQK